MANTKYQDVSHATTLDGDEAWGITDDPGGSPADGYITPDDVARYANMFRYTISATLSTNDLVVALKDLDGNTPSSTYPVYVRIGDAEYIITAALSVTIPAGDNTFNAGVAAFATHAIGLFSYLRYNATDGVCIGVARVPYARLYGDFADNGDDETMTDEKGAVWNDITNAAAGDVCRVIGYFEVENAGAAGYEWSNIDNIIHEPIYKTNWLDWTPTFTGFSVNPSNAVYTYKINYDDVVATLRQVTNGTSNATGFTATLPFTALTLTNGAWQGTSVFAVDNGALVTASQACLVATASNVLTLYKDMSASGWTNANGKRVGSAKIEYRI